MANYAKPAIRTKLQLSDNGSPETFTTVALVSDISGPKMSAETPDTTNHDNADGYREFISTLKTGGEVTFKVYFDPNNTTHSEGASGLIGMFNNGTLGSWRLLFPVSPARSFRFTGLVTSFEPMAAVAGALEASCTIKVSGKPVLQTES